ncbi:methylmalonyl-CoA mutase subunit beta [Christiangramia flava]|uniref:Methylmalonyl-CoA mutase n=1 Tax=Christiangramia flava JLT2011 TaxID=1229726 RepID=A0A1L7I706_9FLAO|nr:methylmalonyl-CoA mutase subunit beta [Christiangramia flava]APU69391.1 Methylmalonyl-CoA mutase [Christiangramia flava JLT2011]OSS37714.1 putative Methylmalonyl-CoA mutase [Christiangramia flava JLT2011]
MKELLFQEFEEVSAKQWKQKIQYDLKGADYNEQLITHTSAGIDIKPFYTAEDVSDLPQIENAANWNICEKIYVTSPAEALRKAQYKIEKGSNAIWLIFPEVDIVLEELLPKLSNNVTWYLQPLFLDPDFCQKLKSFSETQPSAYLLLDVVGKLARTGNFFHNIHSDFEMLQEILQHTRNFKSVLSINAGLYHNAGATIPQQLAYALGHFSEYANRFPEEPQLKVSYQLAIGSDYFQEIAKIRALRWLHRSLAKEFGLPEDCHIIAEPGKRNKTLYDYNVNLLRTTTESMSAILGGADSICNLPYDALYHKDNEFGDRIARNQLLVMRHEAYFGKVGNVADGSYYIETLTRQLADLALDIFKNVENAGGILQQLKDGIIQKKIKQSAAEEQERFNTGDLVLIGTNKHENPQDRMKDDLELFPFLKRKPRKTLIEPVLERRLSEEYEQKRLENESEKPGNDD